MKNNEHANSINNENLSDASRRKVVLGLLGAVGAIMTPSIAHSFELSALSTISDLAKKPFVPKFYSPSELAFVSRLADLIIPDTNTLGALSVGVPAQMDNLYTGWASAESKLKHQSDIASTIVALDALAQKPFMSLNAVEQQASLSLYDTAAYSTDWDSAQHYREIKDLIARFYYWSQVGATEELKYLAVPGRWEGCVPLESVGRTWAT